MEYAYSIITFEDRSDDLSFIKPEIYTEAGSNRFVYDGPNPGHWHGYIKQRHRLVGKFEVMWHLGRQPDAPRNGVANDADFSPSVFVAPARSYRAPPR